MFTVKLITNPGTNQEMETLYQCERVEFVPQKPDNETPPGLYLIGVGDGKATHQYGCEKLTITKAYIMNEQGATISHYTF